MRKLYLVVLLFLVLIFSPHLTEAFIDDADTVSLELSPNYPSPNQTVTVTLNDFALTETVTDIRWFVAGVERTDRTNQRSLTLTTPRRGQLVVEARLATQAGSSLVVRRVIEAINIDIILEPQTRVPGWYQGAALPSLESQINATGLVFVDGEQLPSSDLIFTWSLNNQVLEGGPQRGRGSIAFTTPRGRAFLLTVEVVDNRRSERIGSKTIEMPVFSPTLRFYEVDGSLGVRPFAILDRHFMIGSSVTFWAEPFHLDLRTYSSPDLAEWEVDRETYSNPNQPYELALALAGPSGVSAINFHVRNLTNSATILQGAQGGFEVRY